MYFLKKKKVLDIDELLHNIVSVTSKIAKVQSHHSKSDYVGSSKLFKILKYPL